MHDTVCNFTINGSVLSSAPIADGHINDTYRIETTGGRYVLQRINHNVFRDPAGLMANVRLATDHVRDRLQQRGEVDLLRRVLTVVPTAAGDDLYASPDGEFWRMYLYVDGAHAVGVSPCGEEIFQAAHGFGEFITLLLDLPGDRLCETIPNFHHGPLRYQAFEQAVAGNIASQAAEAADEIAYIQANQAKFAEPQSLLESHALPLRVTHNDTKSNNVLLDDATNHALAVIDLDTVMPGLVLYDFGDLVRTTSTGAAEDETDLAKVVVLPERLEAAASGFLAGLDGGLAAAERESLLLGPRYMALIMAIRFLTDFLNGDTYFKTKHPRHNLDRCRNQIALANGLKQAENGLAKLLQA